MAALCLGAAIGGIEANFWPDKKEAKRGQGKSAEDIDHVMLLSQQRGETNQHEPQHHGGSSQATQVPRVGVDQEKQKRGVERGKEIVRRIHPPEPIEDRAEPTLSVRSRKREPKRRGQETNAGKNDRARNPRDEYFELPHIAEKKWRRDKEEVNRHVRKNHERNERNRALPGEIEDPDVISPPRNPEAGPVNQQKEKG